MGGFAAIGEGSNDLSTATPVSLSTEVVVAPEDVGGGGISVLTWAYIIFRNALADLSSKAQVVAEKLEGKTAAMNQIEALRKTVKDWNDLVTGDQLQIQKTEEILLAGVQIPETSYSRCAYKLSPSSNDIKYAQYPPKVYEDFKINERPADGELVYVRGENAYKVYTKSTMVDVYSPIPFKTVPGPDVDFSTEEVGTLIFVSSSNLYYRVAADGSGVPITGFPLQKFVGTLSDKGRLDLDRVLENRGTAVRDLSKGDLIDLQEFTSLVQVISTFAIG